MPFRRSPEPDAVAMQRTVGMLSGEYAVGMSFAVGFCLSSPTEAVGIPFGDGLCLVVWLHAQRCIKTDAWPL